MTQSGLYRPVNKRISQSANTRGCRPRIEATLKQGLSNALVEGRNTQVRLLHRIAHGFHDVNAFIGLAMLKLAGLCPPLPGRI